jgi:hypothetical protein
MYTRRELMELVLSLEYAENFRHGTPNHTGYMVAAKLCRSSTTRIVRKVVEVFDKGVHRKAEDIVARAIEHAPEEFITEIKL